MQDRSVVPTTLTSVSGGRWNPESVRRVWPGMSVRFTFNVCHDGQWELRDGDVIIAKLSTRTEAMNLAHSLAASARMLGEAADVQEIGPCPPAAQDMAAEDQDGG